MQPLLTLSYALKLLERYASDLEIILGTAVNEAHQKAKLSFRLHTRNQLAEHLKRLMEKLGKQVAVTYY